jgi:hypothetical protein
MEQFDLTIVFSYINMRINCFDFLLLIMELLEEICNIPEHEK